MTVKESSWCSQSRARRRPVHPLPSLAVAGRNYAGGENRPTSMRALCSCRVGLSGWVVHDCFVIGGVDDRLVSFIPSDAEVGMLRSTEHLLDFPTPRRALGDTPDLKPVAGTSRGDISIVGHWPRRSDHPGRSGASVINTHPRRGNYPPFSCSLVAPEDAQCPCRARIYKGQ